MGIDNYPGKRKLLENAVESEKSAAEFIRTVAALTVMAGAKRTALLSGAVPMMIFSATKRRRGLKRPARNRASQAALTGQQLSSSPSSRLPAALFDRFKK